MNTKHTPGDWKAYGTQVTTTLPSDDNKADVMFSVADTKHYELNNHEAYYTGEIEDTLNALGSDYIAEEVREVFNKERALHLND